MPALQHWRLVRLSVVPHERVLMPGSAREERHCNGATLQFVPLQQRQGARRAAEAYVAACYDEDADVGLARRPQLCTAALVEVVSTAAPEAHRTAAPSVSGAASRSVCCALYVNKQCAPVRTCTALPVSAHVHGCASAVWITRVHECACKCACCTYRPCQLRTRVEEA